MTSDLEVDPDGLRRCSTGFADTAARVRTGLATAPPLGVTAPGWAITGGTDALEAAVRRQFATIADAVTTLGRQVTAAADDYDAADQRSAHRLRNVR